MSEITSAAKRLTQAQPLGEHYPLQLVRGEVTARSSSTVDVRQEGAATALPFVRSLMSAGGSYVGQGVWVLDSGTNRVVLGPSESDDPTRCHVRRTSNQTLAHGAFDPVSWTLADDNVGPAGGEMWRSATPTRVYILADGAHLVTWNLRWVPTTAAAEQYGAVIRNGNNNIRYANAGAIKPAVSGASSLNGAEIVELDAGDYLELKAFQTTGTSLALDGTVYTNSLHMHVSWLNGVV